MTQHDFEQIAGMLRSCALTVTTKMMPSGEDAEDAAGDTMLRLWHLHGQISDSGHAMRLATVVARNLATDMLRRQARGNAIFRRNTDTPVAESGYAASPADEMELEEDERWLRQRMEKLPPRELQILQMRQMEHRDNAEIARLLGLAEASVAVMLSKARHKLFNDIKARYRK